jgi:PHD/YefM family antitoxin component YafN of YafNO toxin-antitoxin module
MNVFLQSIPKMASMREVQRNYRVLFDWVRKTKKPLVLTSGSEPYVVVLNISSYEELIKQNTNSAQKEENEEWEKKWQRIRETMSQLRNKGNQTVSLSDFAIKDRDRH